MPSMLDFPLQMAFKKSLTEEVPWWDSPWTAAYEMLGNDFLYPDPFNLVIFPDNHDMSRIYTQVDEDYDLYRMAIVYYLTMRGMPTLYYGTEVLMSHPGTDSHGAIREEFPGGWEDSDKNAFTGDGLSDLEREAQQFVQQLLTWRKSKPVIHSGKMMQFTPIKDVYTYFRYDENDTVMVVFNRSEETSSIDTARFAERLGGADEAVDVITGQAYELNETLELPARSVLVLEITR
jgi:glycosidase